MLASERADAEHHHEEERREYTQGKAQGPFDHHGCTRALSLWIMATGDLRHLWNDGAPLGLARVQAPQPRRDRRAAPLWGRSESIAQTQGGRRGPPRHDGNTHSEDTRPLALRRPRLLPHHEATEARRRDRDELHLA